MNHHLYIFKHFYQFTNTIIIIYIDYWLPLLIISIVISLLYYFNKDLESAKDWVITCLLIQFYNQTEIKHLINLIIIIFYIYNITVVKLINLFKKQFIHFIHEHHPVDKIACEQ